MQNDASNARQLVVERIRQSTNILVAVSTNPSVDALAAALGLALMLNKMDKHATAVFSGAIPPAMDFLNPGKTFENSVDSLRDFIISLDKEKADRLRYKVEADVVRIFITPYRTVIGEKDLQFSQGDFNVDLILSLGVEKREDLDKAIVAHGRILHDATVMTLNVDSRQSSLGVVDWHEAGSSSLCEMLVTLAESLQTPGLVDAQIATALLTGIVAATGRFSNEHTTPRVMTISAQLMAAGANQQLIANNLVRVRETPQAPGAGQLVPGAESVKVAVPTEAPKKDGELDIVHPKPQQPVEPPVVIPTGPAPEPAQQSPEKQGQNTGKSNRNKNRRQNQQQSPEEELAAALPTAAAATNAFDDLKNAIESDSKTAEEPAILKEPKAPGSEGVNGDNEDEDASKEAKGYVVGNSSWRGRRLEPPALGGTLNATTEQAMDDTIKSEQEERNQKLLTHPDDTEPSKTNRGKTIQPPEQKAESKPEPKPKPEAPAPVISDSEPILPPQPEAVAVPEPQPASEPEAPVALAPTPEVPPAPTPEPAIETPPPAPEPAQPPATSGPTLPPAPVEPIPIATPTAPEPAPSSAPAADGADLDAARLAVDAALNSQPFNPSGQPLQSAGAMPLGVSDQNQPAPTLTPAEPVLTPLPPAPVEPQGVNALPPLPPMPPLPQQDPNQPLPPPPSLSDLPPLPSDIPPAPITPPPETPAPETPPAPADPKQFQIPTA